MPHVFDDYTIGEILIVIEGYQERERQNLISRVSAVLRGLGAAFGKQKTDPYKGLLKPKEGKTQGSQDVVLQAFGAKPTSKVEALRKRVTQAKEAWLWRDDE